MKPKNKKDAVQRPIIFENFPQIPPLNSFEHGNNYKEMLNNKTPLYSSFEKATMSDIEVRPCLIREVFFSFVKIIFLFFFWIII